MDKIESFKINHLAMLRGIYVSRKDTTPSGDVLTTFDIRMVEPNRMPHISSPAIHAMEHLAATYLRNDREWGSRIVYWGPWDASQATTSSSRATCSHATYSSSSDAPCIRGHVRRPYTRSHAA